MSPPSRCSHRSVAPIARSFTSTAAATSVVLRQNAIFRWPQRWRWPPTRECTWWTIGSLRKPRFPGAFDDCLRAYHWLVTHSGADPQTLVVLGDSAGGNLAVAVIAAARDQGLAPPARIALISPLADLTISGASIEERKHLDPLVTRQMLESTVTDYLAGADPRDPRCSAIFADMHGFPPMLIQVGENEILYDDATRIRDAATTAGVDVAFESWRHGVHVWPVFISAGLPESAAAVERLATFFKTQAAQ